jgi:hypothetical protein
MLRDLKRLERVSNIEERDTTLAILSALLVVHHKQVTVEELGSDVHNLHTFAGSAVLA